MVSLMPQEKIRVFDGDPTVRKPLAVSGDGVKSPKKSTMHLPGMPIDG